MGHAEIWRQDGLMECHGGDNCRSGDGLNTVYNSYLSIDMHFFQTTAFSFNT